MKIRKTVLCFFAASVGMLLCSCNTTAPVSSPDSDVVVSGAFLSNPSAVEEIRKQHPEIQYKKTESSYNSTNVLPMAVSGQLPTMYSVPYTEPQRIIDAGYAGDVTEVFKQHGYDKLLNKTYLDLVYKDGEYYGVPLFVYNIGLMCNISIFREAGLLDENGCPIYPQTYEELAQTASLIKKRTGKPGFFFATTQNQGGWQFMNIAWSYGVTFIKEEDGRKTAAFNTPECVEALRYVKDLKWKYDALPDEVYGDTDDMLAKYKESGVGMNFFASSEIDRYTSKGWNKDNISLCRIPAGPCGRYSLQGGTVQMFKKDITKEQAEACFLWIDQVYNISTDEKVKKQLEEQCKRKNDIGFVVGYVGKNVWNSPEYDAMVEEIQETNANVDLKYFEDFQNGDGVTCKTEESINAQELYHLFDLAIQTVFLDENADPSQIIADTAEKFQKDYLDKV